ncbi:MAG TPA: hypothetical protein V6D10_01730 [Trichocoleus sp.]|jgi:K+-sensing histidine kinase KdpD
MDSLIESVNSQTVLVIAAIVLLFLLLTLLIKILKANSGLILSILAIVLVLQYFFGISPGQLWGEISNLPQDVIQLVESLDVNSLMSNFSS